MHRLTFAALERDECDATWLRVNAPKTMKNRVHLGTRADDIDAEMQRLVRIGATLAWEEEFPPGWPYRNVVLRDSENNEFCLGNEPRRP